jgi:hypothetical protein
MQIAFLPSLPQESPCPSELRLQLPQHARYDEARWPWRHDTLFELAGVLRAGGRSSDVMRWYGNAVGS